MLLLVIITSSLYISCLRGQQTGAVILWTSSAGASTTLTSGRVQVFYINGWVDICRFASFGLTEADVICHQLGYNGSSSWSSSADDSYGIDPTTGGKISDVSCSSSQYLTLFQCSLATTYNNSCTDDDDVGVSCYTTRIWDNPYNGQIRLTGGDSSNEGLLEIFCNGQWGTVCDDSFGNRNANAACKQLGYETYFMYNHLPMIQGSVSQPISLDEGVDCSSGSICLTSCTICPSSQIHNCGQNDVTLECRSNNPSNNNNNTLYGYCSTATPSVATPSVSPSSVSDISVSPSVSDNGISPSVVGGIVAGSVVGASLVIVLIVVVCVCMYAQHKNGRLSWFRKSNTTTDTEMAEEMQVPPPPFNPSIPTAPPAAAIQYECNNDARSPMPNAPNLFY